MMGLRAAARVGVRTYVFGVAGAVGAALVIGIPTDVVPNPWFRRMTPVRDLDVAFLVMQSVALGVLVATYAPAQSGRRGGRAVGASSGIFGILAIGCPICNKLIVALLGVSGALAWFAPLQPLLGAAGVVLAVAAITARMRGLRRGCALPAGRLG